jgi:hypothetical protein
MNKLILLVALLNYYLLALQNFEGKLVYSINYESKIENVSSKQLNTLMGTKQFYAIKGVITNLQRK